MSKVYDKLMATTKVKTAQELKDEGDELFAIKKAKEEFLLEGYKEKKIKSKALKKQAKKLLALKNKSKNKGKKVKKENGK